MLGFLSLGFLVGMSHALEADHVAAVGALATSGKHSPKRMAVLGASWGLGHTSTLFVVSLIVIGLGFALSELTAASLEFAVGCMLVVLGLNVVRKMWAGNISFRVHQHGDGPSHVHALKGTECRSSATEQGHVHASGFSLRAYLVGLFHGAAGSAALIVLVAATTQSVVSGLLYVLVFGLGSVAGMSLLTYAVSWPLGLGAKVSSRLFTAVQGGAAALAIFVGGEVMMETGEVILSALS